MTPFEIVKQRGLLREAIKRKYNGVLPSERKQPTCVYNCHGLTFLSRRAQLNDPKAVEMILVDDAYFEVDMTDTLPGDIAVYKDETGLISHTGIVIQNEGDSIKCPIVLSKWGQAGEYIHRFNDCPYVELKHPVKFMREGHDD